MSATPKKQPIVFGKYLLLDRINIGGMAEVWRGKTFGAGGFERLVAIKRILPNIAEDDEFKTMFIDEAKISVQLTHSNIAQVHDLGQIGNSLFIAMEYIPGRDLRSIFDRSRKKGEPAPIPLTCYVISKLCDALDYAHRKKDGMGRDMNIVHRDVSPQNVLISFDGEVKVIDFGIAKAAGKATKTQAGILKGKFGYMSPEQIRGLPLDRRSDVFAIGVCLYELLTGERLFVGDSDFSVLEKVRRAEVLAPSTYNRRVPEALERVVLRALAKDVDVRYQYASELFKDLQPFIMTPEVFTQRDLAQYMRSTFAEDVEREKVRLQEYSEVKPPSATEPPDAPTSPNQPAVQLVVAPEVPTPSDPGLLANAIPMGTQSQLATQVAPAQRAAPTPPRLPTSGYPKLTPANSVSAGERDAATQLVQAPSEAVRRTDTDPTWRKGEGPGEDPRRAGVDTEPPGLGLVPAQLVAEPATRSDRPVLAAPTPPGRLHGSSSTLSALSVSVPIAITPTMPATPSAMPNGQNGRAAVAKAFEEPPSPALLPSFPPLTAVPQPEVGSPSPGWPAADVVPTDPPMPAPNAALPSALLARPVVEVVRQPRAAPVQGRASTPRSKLRLLGAAFLGLLLVLSGMVAGYLLHAGASGFLLVELAPGLPGKARVWINGRDYGTPDSWPFLQPVSPGPTAVKVTAEGYKTFVQTIDVTDGKRTTVLRVELTPTAEQTQLVVVTDPETAEVRVNGKVVKREGNGGFRPVRIVLGTEQQVEAVRKGFRAVQQSVTATRSDEPLVLYLKLPPAEFQVIVSSAPGGANIYAGEEILGVTPARIRVSSDISEITVRRRCYEPYTLKLKPPDEHNDVPKLNAELVRQLGCR